MQLANYRYCATVHSVLDDGISLMLTIDLGFYSYVKFHKFSLIGLTPPKTFEARKKAKEFIEQRIPLGSKIIVETFKSVEGDFYIDIVDEIDGNVISFSMIMIEEKIAEYDLETRKKFNIPQGEEVQ